MDNIIYVQEPKLLTSEVVEAAAQACLTQEILTYEQVNVVLEALKALNDENIIDGNYTRKMLIAAQRAWHIMPSERLAIEQVVLSDVFKNYRPKDVEIEGQDEDQTILANSLELSKMSEHFKAVFESSVGEGQVLHQAWSGSQITENWDIALSRPLVRVSVQVSLIAVSLLLENSPSKLAMIMPYQMLQLRPSQESVVRELVHKTYLAELFSNLDATTALDHYISAMKYDPTDQLPQMSYFKNCCVKLFTQNISSLEQCAQVLASVPEECIDDLLARGLKRTQEMLHYAMTSSEELFGVLSGHPTSSDLTPEICCDLLVAQLPQHLKNLPPLVNSNPKKQPKRSIGKILKNGFKGLKSKLNSNIDPAAVQRSQTWLKTFFAIAAHRITHYDHLDIAGLTPYQLCWLLDLIAPYVTHLNLSGFAEETDLLLWSREFPLLEELTMARCRLDSTFTGGARNLPSLRRIDFSDSWRLKEFSSGNGLQLTHLNLRNCSKWGDHTSLTKYQSTLEWIDIVGCNVDFFNSVEWMADRGFVIVSDLIVPYK